MGAITGSVIVIAQRSIIDIPTALRWMFKKLQEPVIVQGAAAIGLALYPLLRR